MSWTRVVANGVAKIEEQWVFRPKAAPLVSLKKGETVGTWTASLLSLTGFNAVVLHTTATDLKQAQRHCEKELRCMGWEW